MADMLNITAHDPSEGAKLSPVALAFSAFVQTTWPLIRSERDLYGFCGQAWDPAVDVWIRDAERAHDDTLTALRAVFSHAATQDGDQLLRIVARLWDRTMRSTDASEVADLRHFAQQKGNIFRIEGRNATSRAVNSMLENALIRLHIYIGFINGPGTDTAVIQLDGVPPKGPSYLEKAEGYMALSF
jgi:hypothetical protein